MFCTSKQTKKSRKLPKIVGRPQAGTAPSDSCSVASFWWDPNHTDIYVDSINNESKVKPDLCRFDLCQDDLGLDVTMEMIPDLILTTDIDSDSRPCDTDISISAGDKYTTSMDTIIEGK